MKPLFNSFVVSDSIDIGHGDKIPPLAVWLAILTVPMLLSISSGTKELLSLVPLIFRRLFADGLVLLVLIEVNQLHEY